MEKPRITRGAVGGIAVEVAVNFVLPYVIFSYEQPKIGDVRALLWSSIPPIVWSVIELVRKRRIDAFSLLVIGGIALGLLAFVGGGSVKLLQLRENLVTGLIGVVFLVSAAIKRPLIYELARATMSRQSAEKATELEQLQSSAAFRRTMLLMTVVWGVGLLVSMGVACALVYALSIREYLIVGPIAGNVLLGLLALWTFWFARKQRRRRVSAQL